MASTYGVKNFSVIGPNADVVWDLITSALELPLIDFLKEKRDKSGIPKCIQEDADTVIKRIEKCSSFHKQSQNKSTEIPQEIKDVLEKYVHTHTLSLSLSLYSFSIILRQYLLYKLVSVFQILGFLMFSLTFLFSNGILMCDDNLFMPVTLLNI